MKCFTKLIKRMCELTKCIKHWTNYREQSPSWEKDKVPKLVKKSLHFMEPAVWLPCSQESTPNASVLGHNIKIYVQVSKWYLSGRLPHLKHSVYICSSPNVYTYNFVGPRILSYNSRTWNLSEKTRSTQRKQKTQYNANKNYQYYSLQKKMHCVT